jgi:hypothetical protein
MTNRKKEKYKRLANNLLKIGQEKEKSKETWTQRLVTHVDRGSAQAEDRSSAWGI